MGFRPARYQARDRRAERRQDVIDLIAWLIVVGLIFIALTAVDPADLAR